MALPRYRINLLILLFAQMIFVSGSAMTVTMGGIIGSQLAPSPALSTLPVSLLVLGTALGTVPAAMLMRRVGRRAGFITAAMIAVAGVLTAKAALAAETFPLYCLGTALVGVSVAFGHQFRFAAAESVSTENTARAISFILLGSIGGAFLGPQLVASGAQLNPESAMQGALSGAIGLYLLSAFILLGFRPVEHHDAETTNESVPARPLSGLLKEPLFLLAVAGGVVGQGTMSFIMTATPVSMHVMDGHSLAATAQVIQFHALAMYVPSLISGWLISWLGERRLMLTGVLIYGVTLVVGLSGHAVMHYSGAMILLGIGWNFLFVGGTTLLVRTYQPRERYRAQTINEAAVFGVSATGSLLAGTILATVGWTAVLFSVIPAVALMGVALVLLRNRPLPLQTT